MPHTTLEQPTASCRAGVVDTHVAVVTDFATLCADYANLFEASGGGAFQHPLWLDAFYRRLVPARNARPLLLTGRDHDGRLQFVLPLILRIKSGVSLLESHDLGVSDYAAPVVRRGFVATAQTRASVAAALPAHDILRIRPVREEAVSSWTELLDITARQLDFSAHATTLKPSVDAWRAVSLSDNFARYLDKKKKRFFKTPGATLRLLGDSMEITKAIGSIQSGRAGRFAGDLIQDDRVRDFYAEVAVEGARAGFARTYALSVEGQDIGHVFGLTQGGRFHYLLIACDYETHGRHSPGLILYDGMISDWISAGGTVFDFTIGDEPFKLDFGTHPTAMFELRSLPTWRGRLAHAAFEAREQLKRIREARAARTTK